MPIESETLEQRLQAMVAVNVRLERELQATEAELRSTIHKMGLGLGFGPKRIAVETDGAFARIAAKLSADETSDRLQ
jgi:hypothetical protein